MDEVNSTTNSYYQGNVVSGVFYTGLDLRAVLIEKKRGSSASQTKVTKPERITFLAPRSTSVFKSDIIISFLKDHSLKKHWIDQNPQLTEMITSGILLAGGTEALFASCINNPVFRQDLENYINELIPFEEEAGINQLL